MPYGYRLKHFLDEEALCMASAQLQHASIKSADFASCKRRIKEKDLVFLDPPYTVSHNSNGFIKYNQKLFSLDDQERLSDFVNYIRDVGAYYILTNAAHPIISEIFEKGDSRIELSRASLIGGAKAKRGQITEYVFTNVPGGEKNGF